MARKSFLWGFVCGAALIILIIRQTSPFTSNSSRPSGQAYTMIESNGQPAAYFFGWNDNLKVCNNLSGNTLFARDVVNIQNPDDARNLIILLRRNLISLPGRNEIREWAKDCVPGIKVRGNAGFGEKIRFGIW